MINLFDFQNDAKSFLLDKTNDPNSKKRIIVKSPTGSGKTVILLDYIKDYLFYGNEKQIFIWFTPGKGDLEEQSKKRMEEFIPNAKTGNVHDVLLQGFKPGYTYFINWEMITNKKNLAVKESENKNLIERIIEAHRNQLSFITIIDEEHLNNTKKADNILEVINAHREIRVSATTVKNPLAEFYEIPEEEVINSGLITKALHINQDVGATEMDDLESETIYLLQKADEKRKQIKSEYEKIGENINPLVLIQFPDMSESLIKHVEEYLNDMGYSYKNKMLAKWLSDEKINIENVTENNAPSNFLIMKQAISTGWDCPRAKILVKLRENMTESFEIQTIGRIRRMPNSKHYDNDVLDFCYLYTFDEKYKEAVIQSGNAYEVKKLFLKDEYKNFELVKEYRNRDHDYGVDEKLVFDRAYDFFYKKYKLSSKKEENKNLLETYGYKMGTKVFSTFRTGKFIKLKDIYDESIGENREIAYEVSTHDHGIDCLHTVDIIKKITGLPSQKMRAILRKLFDKITPSNKKILSLSNREWYAFMINNAYKLRDDFVEMSSSNSRQLQILPIKTEKWKLPQEVFYNYLPSESNIEEYTKNVYKDYNTSMITSQFRSTSEQLFENYLEGNDEIDWYYKNGDTGQQYLSIVYTTGFNNEYLFYPDYILKKKNGEIWIIETKGGERKGVSKNIDKQVENKFNAFKEYAEKHKLNFGIVRDKDTRLFINNTEYVEDMDNPVWEIIDKKL